MESQLEDIIDSALAPNDTFLFSGNQSDDNLSEIIHGSCVLAVEWLGILADILIICTILRNWRMRTRRNLILLNWAIFDSLYLTNLFGLIIELSLIFQEDSMYSPYDFCLIIHAQGLFKMISSCMILTLMSTVVLRTTVVKDWVIIAATYLVGAIIFISNFLFCLHSYSQLIYMFYLLLMLTQLVILIAKEINMCCKAHRDDPISDKTRIIINIARIFIYNHLFLMIYFFWDYIGLMGTILSYLELTIPATSIYIFVYLLVADENFQNCVRNLICKCGKATERDATVTYTDNDTLNQVNVDFARIQDD